MGRIVGLVFPEEKTGYVCPVCGKVCSSETSLKKHRDKEHPGK